MKPEILLLAFAAIVGCFGFFAMRSIRHDTDKAWADCAGRYELRDTGVVGLTIRLDKQTGEVKFIHAISGEVTDSRQ